MAADAPDAMLVGMDLGTSSTAALFEGGNLYLPTVVGYPKSGVLPGLLPNGGGTLFGDEALIHHNLVDVVWPVRQGTIAEQNAASEFASRVAALLDPTRRKRLHVVVGTPPTRRPSTWRPPGMPWRRASTKCSSTPSPSWS